MSDFNRVLLLGRIGNDVELKNSAQGKPYLKLSLATHNYKGGEEKVTYWHRVLVFGPQAEVCATYLKKGSQVFVEGSLEVRTYTNDEGRKITSVSVIANRVQFLGGRMSAEVKADDDIDAAIAASA